MDVSILTTYFAPISIDLAVTLIVLATSSNC